MIKSLSKIYFSLLVLSPLVPRFDTADVIAADYIALTITAIFGVLILIIQKETILSRDIKFKTPLILLFFFLIISLMSISFSVNKVTSLVSFIKLFVIVVHLYLIYALRVYKLLSINYILLLCSILLLVEISTSLYPLYYEIFPVRKYEYRFAMFLSGITGNRNITAASIVLKIPLVILFIYRVKKNYQKYALISLLMIAIINLYFLSSRAALLSLFIIFMFYVLNAALEIFKEKNIKPFIKRISIASIILALTYFYFSSNIVEDDRSSIQSRVTSISSNDESASQRLRFYKQALYYFAENPVNPVGLGNWKLYSIKLDKERINSYIIPYVVHNDFLEILIETSLLGFILYIGFYLSLGYIILKLFFKQKEFKDKVEIIMLGATLTCYLVDANLNFPLYRPIMQVNLLILITLILSYYNKSFLLDEKNI
jgi:O-antigen ligase